MASRSDGRGEPIIVVLLGPPGCGKGTQAGRLVEEFRFKHYSTGQILREEIRRETDLGMQVRELMESGELVPDEIVGKIVKARLDRLSGPGCVLDGYPRNLSQAEYLDEIRGSKPLTVVNICVPDEVVVKRLAGRRFCANCGNIYNAYFSPPERVGVCDRCGGELLRREDDREEVVYERLRVYHEETQPLVRFYKGRDSYEEVNGDQAADQVYDEIGRAVGTMVP